MFLIWKHSTPSAPLQPWGVTLPASTAGDRLPHRYTRPARFSRVFQQRGPKVGFYPIGDMDGFEYFFGGNSVEAARLEERRVHMPDQKARKKSKYESPVLVPLGEMAKGSGVCTAGSSVVAPACGPGGADVGSYCTCGAAPTGRLEDCGAGDYAYRDCTAGPNAPRDCSRGECAQRACTAGVDATAGCTAGTAFV